MDELGNLSQGKNAALVVLAFLQADCRTPEYGEELLALGRDLNLTREVICKGPLEDGDLETDGHLSSHLSTAICDLQPSVELQWPRDREEAADLQQIAEELREIADQLEHNMVAQATQNLSRNISVSPSDQWKCHLTQEVERVMQQGVGLENLPHERVLVALTLTLVKGVCEQAPRLLRGLFNTALQYLNPTR